MKLADAVSLSPIKAIIAASSGLGKTGALWSLAAAGFNLRIYDADRGYPILFSILKDNPDALDRVEVAHFSNKLKGGTKGYSQPTGTPTAWPDFLKALNRWPDGPAAPEPATGPLTWGPDTVMVVDSLTIMGKHALMYSQQLGNTLGSKPEWTDYGTAQAQLESMFALLYGEEVACHVLFLTHVKNAHDKDGNFIGAFPSSVGQALNEVIPRYVNNILSIKMTGIGPKAKRYLSTKPVSNQIATKTEDLDVRDEYQLTDGTTPKPGLAEFFADCGWPSPKEQ